MSQVEFWDPDTQSRLEIQLRRVYNVMRDGKWRSLQELADATGDPPASVSARLRDLRNRFGYTVSRIHAGKGLYLYSVEDSQPFAPRRPAG